jgi:MFS family permease
MSKKQLATMFACNLVGWTIFQSMINLLPVYAARLGANAAWAGNYMAMNFVALTLGTVATGWLSDKFQRRKALLVVAGLVNVPATWLMGRATEFWHLAVLTAIVFFLVGVGFTTINILAGLFAKESERGKIFGLLAINISLGALIGGAVSGSIADHWGYPALFLLCSLCWILQPLIALFLQDKMVRRVRHETASAPPIRLAFGRAFYLLLLANLIAFGANFIGVLGRPLMMDEVHFDSTAISGVAAVGGAISLPFPLLLGWLSDRMSRSWLIVICYICSAIGLAGLAESASLWHFWASAILLSGVGVSFGIGQALVIDLVPLEDLGRALSWYGFAPPMAGILGFVFAGYAIQSFGMAPTLIAGAILTLIAVALVIWVQQSRVPGLDEYLAKI